MPSPRHSLLLRGIGDKEQLQQAGVQPRVQMPGVGRGMQDHSGAGIGFTFKTDVDLKPRAITSEGIFCLLQSPTTLGS